MIGILISLATLLLGAVSAVHAASGKPNVLFIAVDDLNDWVGCLGGNPQAINPGDRP